MSSGLSTAAAFLAFLPLVLGTALAIGLIVAVVMGVRALASIDRSLRALVEQGVARGEGPYDGPPR